MNFTPSELKKLDNKLTFVIGYRNLYNILVLASGSVLLIYAPIGAGMVSTVPFIVFILGAKWFLTQMHENVDAMTVEDM